MSNTPFFIVGPPRSGTTLLEQTLNRHSRLYIPPETAFFEHLKRQNILAQPFSADRMRVFLNHYFSCRPAKLWEKTPARTEYKFLLDRSESYSDVFRRLADWLLTASGKARFGEKTPSHLRVAGYLLENFPDAKFIGVVRDGRASIKSRMNHPYWESNLYSASLDWRDDAAKLRELLVGAHANRFHLVKFEKMIEEPERVLSEVCMFLGEDYEPGMHMPTQDKGASEVSRPKFYRRPWMEKSTKALDPTRVSSWIEEYQPNELALIEHFIDKELVHFGYPPMSTGRESWHLLLAKELSRHALFRVRRFTRTSKQRTD